MKVAALYIAVFALAILLIPMFALNFDLDIQPDMQAQVHAPAMPDNSAAVQENRSAAPEEASPADIPAGDGNEAADEGEEGEDARPPSYPVSGAGVASFRILDETTGEVAEVALRDFVRGAVAAEMPVGFHSEALKAQAVAAHTYALHNHFVQQGSPDPELKGADFSADPGNLKVYMTEAQAREFYGEENADRYWSKVCEAADSVLEYVLEYEDVPIVAAYHAISAGRTEDAANVWTGSAPYLLPADSEGDLLAPDFESKAVFPAEELREKLTAAYPDMELGDDPAAWFGGEERSESGYVTAIEVGGVALHGKDLRELLDLRSHNFDIACADGAVTFYVYGYGHGVGLSQYGADFLARQGRAFDEILANYYTGTELRRLELPEGV